MTFLSLLISLLTGSVFGLAFFGGLWLTIQWTQHSRHPALLTVASFWVRTLLVIAGLLMILKADWLQGAAYLLGFLLMRLVFVRHAHPV